jgi:hypothetical protein
MEFYATTFDNIHDVIGRNDCTKDMSARLVSVETCLVTEGLKNSLRKGRPNQLKNQK